MHYSRPDAIRAPRLVGGAGENAGQPQGWSRRPLGDWDVADQTRRVSSARPRGVASSDRMPRRKYATIRSLT